MPKFLFDIKRTNGSALVSIYRIDMIDGLPRMGDLVTQYETASDGATKSARKTIKQMEAV
jgi:hypothetical protein